MKHLIKTILVVIALATTAYSGIPDMNMTLWESRSDEDVVVLICPAGDTPGLAEAWPATGDAVDATIDVWVNDANDVPVVGYPFEDIWLEAPGLDFCPSGSVATSNTDVTGHTTIVFLAGGGSCEPGTIQVMINGLAATGSAPGLRIVSPDVSGDLAISLVDIGLLAGVFFGQYETRADLDGDGDVDLSDVVFLARHQTHACP